MIITYREAFQGIPGSHAPLSSPLEISVPPP